MYKVEGKKLAMFVNFFNDLMQILLEKTKNNLLGLVLETKLQVQ